jgi:hypothetical protein
VNDQLKPKREDLTSGKEALTSAYVQVRAFSRWPLGTGIDPRSPPFLGGLWEECGRRVPLDRFPPTPSRLREVTTTWDADVAGQVDAVIAPAATVS